MIAAGFFRAWSLDLGTWLVVTLSVLLLGRMAVHTSGRHLPGGARRAAGALTLLLLIAFIVDVVGRYRAFS